MYNELKGWVGVAESPYWVAWPNRPTTKKMIWAAQQQGCKFLEVSRRCKGQLIWQGMTLICKGGTFICEAGTLICIRERKFAEEGTLFAHVYEPLENGKNSSGYHARVQTNADGLILWDYIGKSCLCPLVANICNFRKGEKSDYYFLPLNLLSAVVPTI